MVLKFKNFDIIQINPFTIQVCTKITPDKIKKLTNDLNIFHPSGNSNGWKISELESEKPVKCAEYPEKYHYIFEC